MARDWMWMDLTEGIGDYTVLRNTIRVLEGSGISSLIVYSGNFEIEQLESELTEFRTFPRRGTPFLNTMMSNRRASRLLRNLDESEIPNLAMVNWKLLPGFLRARKKNPLLKRCKVIVEDRSPPVGRSLISRMQWLFYDYSWRKVAGQVDMANVLVPSLEDFIRKRHNVPSELPFIHTPSGVDVNNFRPSEKFEPLSGTVKIVYHGALDEGRGLERIPQLLECLESKGVSARATIIGDGPLSGKFQSLADSGQSIVFLGKLSADELPRAVSNHDYGILPLPDALEWNVGSPLKIMEFASSGLVCLTTDVQGTKPFHGQDWIRRANRYDPIAEWVSIIEEDSNNKEGFLPKRGKARKFALEGMTWDSALIGLIGLIDSMR